MNDRELCSRQLTTLALLDEAHRATAWGAFYAGCAFALLGLSCPAMGALGMALEPFVHAAFVHRMANLPIWVMALMTICGVFLGSVGLVFGFRERNAGSPALAHLRANPDDPIVASQCQVQVRSGNRTAYFFFTTRKGVVLEQIATSTWEPKILAALDAAVPR